jgi:hypothetical protein
MEERQFYIPGTNDALIVGVAEFEPPHLRKPGSRWLLIHAQSGLRLSPFNAVTGWAIGQVAFNANWLYRSFPSDHWVWTETDPERVRACLEPVSEQSLHIKDWSEYQNSRGTRIKDEISRLVLLMLDYGISDHPDNEESEEVRQIFQRTREANESLGHPPPGNGYEDSPDQNRELLELRVMRCTTTTAWRF